MWIFWMCEIFCFIVLLLLIFGYCYYSERRYFQFIWKHLKWVGLAILIVLLLIAFMFRGHLYDAMQCSFRGNSMKANTKYSIYLGECQIETPRGSFVPIDRARSIPDGSKTEDSGNNDDYFGN